MGKSRITFSKKSLETIRVELLWREVVWSRFSSVMGNMKILLTMAIVLGALIIVQASSSKEFTLVDTVKNCNCMDYLKWKIWLYSWLSHLSYWPGVPLWEKSGSIIGRIQFVSFSLLSNIEILTNFFESLPRSLFRGFSIGSTSFVLSSMALVTLTIANVFPCRKPAPLMPHNSGGSETSQNRYNSISCRSSQINSDVIFGHEIIVIINIQISSLSASWSGSFHPFYPAT